ncbi:MAG: hypothetical protein ACREV9_01285 [Burkholderiales bacterium]
MPQEEIVRLSEEQYVILSGLLDQYWLPRVHPHPFALGSAFTSFDVSWVPVIWKSKDEFLHMVRDMLESEPFENGVRHALEESVRKALRSDRRVRDWIRVAVLETFEDSFAADLLRCIGRMDYQLVGGWAIELAEAALASRSVELRDASLQALESWGRPSLVALRAHLVREQTNWLRAYTDQVIRELQA